MHIHFNTFIFQSITEKKIHPHMTSQKSITVIPKNCYYVIKLPLGGDKVGLLMNIPNII